MDTCKRENIHYKWLGKTSRGRQEIEISCKDCGIKEILPSLTYFEMWGYPAGRDNEQPFEWLHNTKRKDEQEMDNSKIKVAFVDVENNVTLGTSNIPFVAITKLNIGDVIEFKEVVGSILGMYEIKSFAVNQGAPEGAINLVPLKPKVKIKLQQVNTDYTDSLLPF